MIHDELYEIGLEQRRKMFGPAGAEDQVEHTTEITDKLQDFVTRNCFGDLWQRDGLSIADRSKITIAMLLATGRSHETRVHMRGGLANGLSVEEIREIALQSMLYCGIPTGVEGIRALEEILADRDATTDAANPAATTSSNPSLS
ncbi:carboxymuconolactone decarboxylase family protein [Arthrobacter koreensis]|uniref:carboxymuconolactone decarboxylase family protein n=1 Tax=Arthrobacter koreensis TaxID=199136 RepID=UPI0036DE5DD0